jgi:hypothetical protein
MKSQLIAVMLMVLGGGALAVPLHARASDEFTIEIRGGPPGAVLDVVVSGANGLKTVTMVNGMGSIAGDFMNDGKSIDVYTDRCKDNVSVTIHERGLPPPPKAEGCDRTVEAAVWRSGARLTVDVRSGQVVMETSGASPAVGLYPFASINVGGSTFPNVTTADPTIRARYSASNYDQSATTVDKRDTGFGFEGGMRIGHKRIAAELSYGYASFGGGTVDTNGSRVLNDLSFSLAASFHASTHSANLAVPIQLIQRWGIEIAPLVKLNWWSLEQEIVDSLSAAGRQVRGGTATSTREGTDLSYGVKVRSVPAERIVLEFGYEHLRLDDAFENDGPAAWPSDVTHDRVTAGVTVFPFGRGGW